MKDKTRPAPAQLVTSLKSALLTCVRVVVADLNIPELNTAGNVAVVKLLLAHGASPDATCDAGPPVMWAAGSGKVATLQALLQAGADPNAAANSNVTPALAASAAGKTEPANVLQCTTLAAITGTSLYVLVRAVHSLVGLSGVASCDLI